MCQPQFSADKDCEKVSTTSVLPAKMTTKLPLGQVKIRLDK